MSFLRHVKSSNDHDPALYRPFRIEGIQVGKVRPALVQALERWPEVFEVGADGSVDLNPKLRGFDERTEAVAGVLPGLVEMGFLRHIKGEPYAVTASTPKHALLLIDRAAAPAFGIRAFGQHMNGFVREGERVLMWISRRARSRPTYPGKLDNLVAGGLPYGIDLAKNLAKECWEEAAIEPALSAEALPVGLITYNRDSVLGFKPDTIYCYDLELPWGFEPRCTDGEVEGFHLWPVEEVAERVRESDDFKPNVNLVLIDFLVRHGYLGPERSDYLDIVTGLRPQPFFTPGWE